MTLRRTVSSVIRREQEATSVPRDLTASIAATGTPLYAPVANRSRTVATCSTHVTTAETLDLAQETDVSLERSVVTREKADPESSKGPLLSPFTTGSTG